MYSAFLLIHSLLRWVVVLAGLIVIARAITGISSRRDWRPGDANAVRWFSIALDVQFLIGLLLYVWLSPVSWAFFRDVGGSMKDPMLRFFGIEHIVGMIVAVTVIHIARGRSRHAASDRLRHRKVWISTLVAILIVAASIPWPVLSYARPLFR